MGAGSLDIYISNEKDRRFSNSIFTNGKYYGYLSQIVLDCRYLDYLKNKLTIIKL